MLVEVTTVDGLVNELKKGRYRSSNDVRRKSEIYAQLSSFILIDSITQ